MDCRAHIFKLIFNVFCNISYFFLACIMCNFVVLLLSYWDGSADRDDFGSTKHGMAQGFQNLTL